MNYKRHKPRRQVRCVLCTPNRDGNHGKKEGGAATDEQARGSFGPARKKGRKQRKPKPFELWVRFIGSEDHWPWFFRNWGEWRCDGRFRTRHDAEHELAKRLRCLWGRPDRWEYEVRVV